ncbi:MAG: hypothetical protein OIF57_18510 [Marinobacterium sp.]|nr:hypothetical protein [Marinobacterium sp.]
MGILNGPRINFWGGIRTNVALANNQQIFSGEKIVDLVNPSVVPGMNHTDESIVAFLQEPTLEGYFTKGGWNYYGDHQVSFRDAKVSSAGMPGEIKTTAALVDTPVFLLGSLDPKTGEGPFASPVMVDLDPTGSTSTQIYVGGLQIGTGDKPKLLIRHNTVCSSHDLNRRIIAGAKDSPDSSMINGTFQLFFPMDSVVEWDQQDESLKAIIGDPQATGIVLRFCMFEMNPELTTDQLVEQYKDNMSPSNPSIGRVVGTLAAAYAGEPKSCPQGRLLRGEWRDYDTQHQASSYDYQQDNKPQAMNTTGYAELSASCLSMDTLSLMLKAKFRAERTNITGPIDPNIDMGCLTLYAGATEVTRYNDQPSDYYLYGGIIDLPVDEGQHTALASSAIRISASADKSAGPGRYTLDVNEAAIRIYSESRNTYLDDGATSFDMTLEIRELGGTLKTDTTLSCSPGRSGLLPQPDLSEFSTKMAGCHVLPQTMTDPVPACLAETPDAEAIWNSLKEVLMPKFLGTPQEISAAAGSSQVTINISVASAPVPENEMPYYYAGIAAYKIKAVDAPETNYFANFRKYPSVLTASAPGMDGQLVAAPVVGEEVSWEQVYAYVLRFYYLIFPAMSKRMPLNFADVVNGAGPQMLARTSDTYRDTSLYMPIVRSMTPVQVRLLHAYLNKETWQG